MSYFQTPQAAYRATRLAQLLDQGTPRFVAAMPNGNVMANYGGHLHLFKLDREGKVQLLDSGDVIEPKQTATIVEIDG